MKKPRIVVAGSCNVDMSAYMPRFPLDGETVFGDSIQFGPGGKGSNQATAASRAGGEVSFITSVGGDAFGQMLLDHYKNEGMSDKYISVSSQAQTGTAIIEISGESGENRIIVINGANACVSPADIDKAEEEIERCDMLLVQLEIPLESVSRALELAREHGVPTVLNPAPMQPVPEGFFEGLDYLTPNETEASFFTGMPVDNEEQALEAAKRLLEMGPRNVIITLGKKGALLVNKDGHTLIPAIPAKAVDTTGAGDAFNGALCVALSEGKGIKDAIRFANCAASISVTRKGAAVAMATRSEIDILEARSKIGTENA
jgi:ribokinase